MGAACSVFARNKRFSERIALWKLDCYSRNQPIILGRNQKHSPFKEHHYEIVSPEESNKPTRRRYTLTFFWDFKKSNEQTRHSVSRRHSIAVSRRDMGKRPSLEIGLQNMSRREFSRRDVSRRLFDG